MKKYLSILFVFILSCQFLYPSKKVLGEWDCVSWTIEGAPGKYDLTKTNFNFMENDKYEATISGNKEKGIFYVEGDKLLTTADNANQIMTQIDKISEDTLVLTLNREGTNEQMTFIRKK